MNILIIEDEPLAQAKLERMLTAIDPTLVIQAKLGSVKESIQWLSHHEPPDVAFVDIQLSDDHSFEIFRSVPARFPVIFTTAFDKYLLESFEFNSIDYLLKPISEEKLARSLQKLKTLKKHFLQVAIQDLISLEKPAKKRIVARKGAEFVALELDEVAYFYSEQKIAFVRDIHGNQFMLDKTLGEWESIVGTEDFFRVNRKFLVHRKAIERFKSDNGKVKVTLKPPVVEDVHVSKEGAGEFRSWMES